MSDQVFDGLGEGEETGAAVAQEEVAEEQPKPTPSKRGAKSKGKTAAKADTETDHIIRLHDSSEFPPGGLTVGINGRFFRLRPDVDMQVPESVLEVLDHAVRTEAKLNSDNQVIGQRNVPRFPYTMVRGR